MALSPAGGIHKRKHRTQHEPYLLYAVFEGASTTIYHTGTE